MKKPIAPEPYVGAMPVVIVAVKDGEKINFAPHGMYGQLSYDPSLIYVSVVKDHLTAKIIQKTKRFSVNIPGTELLEKIIYCGRISGAEVDKSREFDVFYGKNDTPMISECPVNLSCEVYDSIDTKDMTVYIGRVEEAFSNEECLADNIPEATKVDPLICTIQGKFYGMGKEVNRQVVFMNEKNILNVLNGQAMNDYFMQHHLDENGAYAPFNEAMCAGEASGDIFSDEFIKTRCTAHGVTVEQYEKITLDPLKVLFGKQFSHVVLWFDDDMFCQINLLTLLAYLEQSNFTGKITFNMVDREFKVVDCFELEVQGYHKVYEQVIIDKCMPENISLPVLENGIKLYLEYLKDENEITAYIKQYGDLESDILLNRLLKTFTQYGLGDTQYMQLIQKIRENN